MKIDVAGLNNISAKKLVLIKEFTIKIYSINVWETSMDKTVYREVKMKASFLVEEKKKKLGLSKFNYIAFHLRPLVIKPFAVEGKHWLKLCCMYMGK